MAEVQYEEASRVYPGSPPVRAVDRLNLDIVDGEFLVLVGPSGSGKSTALRMLAGLEDVNEGKIIIGGRDVTHVPPKNRDIAMVFQSYALYPHMTVAENMGFALKLRGVNKAEIATKVREAAGLLDLEKYLDRKPKALSGGQRQRVAMGRAIVREPSVFLMDEPLSNLDAKLRVETRANIAELQARLGTTTVYVTHDQVEAMTMGHRVAVLKDGILQQVDTPRNLYDQPSNVFVAGFMGSPAMNLVTVPLTSEGAQLGETTVPLPRELMSEASSKGLKEVIFGVRPENFTLSGQGIPVTVDLVEELGADAFVHGHSPDGGRLVIRIDARQSLTQGSTIRATPTDPEHLHLFDPSTGLRLSSSRAVPADAVAGGSTSLSK
ncbi:sn-glycerol-3-phosphate ABC transporter ATP-binding protein UgpC [Nakamurella flavida]|uniref:Sn-glycerol-3-phosphate ABC transporter ATP-binding protein UgpC n=1 Tax=Nakamurella flavida TaxID=363630 RepID=A0A938YNV2_9ACTN|nr:sn-glycerol-3-phosphate ABC transporter ATP-binding protein UgpC [Nakamurella flavida]MBM9477986.1 sn-glycerol-3-phosphate ABC transporter ATP-binding protein UgpC [Nakamurella flavida]MDP9778298.1 multiple sugar transport system ATP-binding protein [Nakamurella flavida]